MEEGGGGEEDGGVGVIGVVTPPQPNLGRGVGSDYELLPRASRFRKLEACGKGEKDDGADLIDALARALSRCIRGRASYGARNGTAHLEAQTLGGCINRYMSACVQ
jgi:hypothetical protein